MWTEDDRKFVRQLRVATTENKIYEVVSNYYGNVKVKQSMAFHNAIISLFSKPTNDEEVLEALKVIYPKYAIVYPNLNSRRQRLSDVRKKAIEPHQSEKVYEMSKLDKYFNLNEDERIDIVEGYKKDVKAKNEQKIQIDVRDVMAKMNDMILSSDPYLKLLALMIAIGARPVEIFDKNTYELIPDKPSWLRVNNLAKKREGQINYTERPVVLFTPQFVIDQVKSIRNHFKKKNAVIINNEGVLDKQKNNELNKRIIKIFPWLSEYTQKSSMLRKLYASLSYSNFANPKTTNFNTWVSNVLGHGDMLTSFSYSWVNVADPEEIKAEGIKTELEELRRKIDLYLNLKNTNEIESENDTAECKYETLGKRASREDKYKLLEQIWTDYGGKITNIKLREISKIGAVIVNEFIKEKKGDSEKKEAPQETKSQEPAAATEPLRRSTRTKNKKKTNT